MLFKTRKRSPVLIGVARVDRRTKDLIHRLRPGEVAIIDHENLDRVSAEGLVERGAAAVVNASSSITGLYPNTGPLVLAQAGIPLLDRAGQSVLDVVHDGDRVTIEGDRVLIGEQEVASAVRLEGEELRRQVFEAEQAVGDTLEAFVANTMDYLQRERGLILRGEGCPATRTSFQGRHAMVVVRGWEFKQDLRTLRGYVTDMRPVLVAVDGAADALLEEGLKPDVIIGDMDSVSTDALTCGAELIVHAYPDGRAPGLERLQALGLEAKTFASAGTSEDIAMLLAYEHGADLIVAVGAHANLVEFLDKGRGGMASTFLVRLRIGPKLVDAKGVNRLYRSQISGGLIAALVLSAAIVLVIAGTITPGVHAWFENLGERFSDLWYRIRHLF